MGAIKSKPQVDMNGQETGNTELEIIYGGDDAPFGGIDSSAPDTYIAPNAFSNANGFVVSNKQLVACGFNLANINLQSFPVNATLMGYGSFYANGAYHNFAVASSSTRFNGNPGYTTATYYIWVWLPTILGNIPLTATLPVQQYDNTVVAAPATAKVYISGGTAIASGSVGVVINGTTVTAPITVGNQPPDRAAQLVANINSAGVAATAAIIGGSTSGILLTTTATGAAANSTTLATTLTGNTGIGITLGQAFQGGADASSKIIGIPITNISYTCVGEVLYIGGPGSVILQFQFDSNGNPQFSILTQYVGAMTLGKFAGSLVAGGVLPGPSVTIQNSEMVLAWSAANNLSTWSPVDSNGNVTGAGFIQVGDISDYISGLFVMDSLLVILRAQGIDYATATGNALQPFDINHIALAQLGEGCQDFRLASQYNKSGFFVGNSDVWQYNQGLKPIGQKIRNLVYNQVASGNNQLRDSAAGPFQLLGTLDVYAFFLVQNTLYIYNTSNETWMITQFTGSQPGGLPIPSYLGFFPFLASQAGLYQFYNAYNMYLCFQNPGQTPSFWQITDALQTVDLAYGEDAFVTFPREEVMMGRDVTVRGVYINLAASPGITLNFLINGNQVATLVTPATAAIGTNAYYTVFFPNVTVKSPQLTIQVPRAPSNTVLKLGIAKLTLFATFDPNQKPIQ